MEQNVAQLGLGPDEVKWAHAYKATFQKNLSAPTDSRGLKRNILIGGDDAEVHNALSRALSLSLCVYVCVCECAFLLCVCVSVCMRAPPLSPSLSLPLICMLIPP